MKSNKKTRTDKSGVALQPMDPIHPVKLVCTFYIPLDGSRLSTAINKSRIKIKKRLGRKKKAKFHGFALRVILVPGVLPIHLQNELWDCRKCDSFFAILT